MKSFPLRWRSRTPNIRSCRRAGSAGLAAAAIASLTLVPVSSAHAQEDCLRAEYQASTWSTGPDSGGFLATIVITNICDSPVDGWTLRLTLPTGHAFTQGWSASWTATGDQLTATDLGWNRVLTPGVSITVGFVGAWVGDYQDPLTCTINGRACGGAPVENEPPEVTLTSPADGFMDILGCAVRFAAEASDPDGMVDRVELYLNGVLIGADEEAPYEIEHTLNPLRHGDNTAFARVFDDGNPQLSADSQPVTFQMLTPPPGSSDDDCRSGVPPVPPEVSLTRPAGGLAGVTSPCPFVLAAEASDPDGTVDRVEFYVNNVLVGTDDTAPYLIGVGLGMLPPPAPSLDWVAFARAYDSDAPPLSSDSPPVTFRVAIGDPIPETIIACLSSLELRAGSSEPVRFAVFSSVADQVTLTVSGDPGVTVTPTTVAVNGNLVVATVSAAEGSAGATATVTATAGGLRPASISVTVS